MALIGNIAEYNEEAESFVDYADRVDAFFSANDIPPQNKVNVFLAIIGAKTYKLLKNLCSPDEPKSKTFADLRKLLCDHYAPAPITIAERYKFWTASQKENESVADFIVRLKTLSSTCKFGAFLQEALRDKLVSGLNSKMTKTQTFLLTRANLTFENAKSKCLADEMAERANMSTVTQPTSFSTHRVQGGKGKLGLHQKPQCKCCGRKNHVTSECFFKDAVCNACGEKGHIKPVCPHPRNSKQSSRPPSSKQSSSQRGTAKHVDTDDEQDSDTVASIADDNMFGLYHVHSKNKNEPYVVNVNVQNVTVSMEIDTGASRSTISEKVYNDKLSQFPLSECSISLTSYSGQNVPVLGCIRVPLTYKDKTISGDLIVVKGTKASLFGRDLLNQFVLDWESVFKVECGTKSGIDELLLSHQKLFETSRTGITGIKASIRLKPDVKPVYQKSRPVPYSIKEKVEKEYDRLIQADILHEIDHSEWASPAVHVPKSDQSIRVCGDYKAVNELIENDGYKLPTAQDLFTKLVEEGSPKVFSVLDLSGAFNQLFLDEESAKLLVINTHRGLLATKRLCFGVKTAPSIFQATMDKILSGVSNVVCFIDDVLIATDDVDQHMSVLKEVFARFEKFNVRLNKDKCRFLKSEVRFLGHMLSAKGVSPVDDKVRAIKEVPRPTNVSELKSFVGMLNYYGKFVPNLSSCLSPLYALLHHSATWKWTKDCEEAFQDAKNVLSGDPILVHYDRNKELVLSVDASPYGIGAVISHRLDDGTEKPIAYASRTLTAAEKNYAQIEREGLAIVFGIKKFHLYLYGRSFLLVTDHKPLTRIFGPKSGIPPLAAARMQRWALLLSGYQYQIVYRSSGDNANADMLSRLPLTKKDSEEEDPDENYIFQAVVDSLPVTAKRIADQTRKDPLLVKVLEFTLSGWSEAECKNDSLRPYWFRREELSLDDGCLLWGRRVVVPESLQDQMLDELHECHPGMCRMKSLARSYVWWPGIDEDIEMRVRRCALCTDVQNSPKKVPLLLWPWATSPWERIHLDFAEIKGQNFLIVVDSYSKWLEVFPMRQTKASDTIEVLRTLFARYGLPVQVVSDNGPQFISEEFREFLRLNNVKHTLCPPYHPSSNGLAEKYVQTFKRLFGKTSTELSLKHRVAKVLFNYRNVPHTTTGISPAELFLKRSPRTHLSLVKPCLQRKVESRQAASKEQCDGRTPVMRNFDLNQNVKVRNTRGNREKWIPGVIVDIKGPSTYLVRVPGNSRRYVHADHLIPDDSFTRTDGYSESKDYEELPSIVQDMPLPRVVPQVEPIVPHVEPNPVVSDQHTSDCSPESLTDSLPSKVNVSPRIPPPSVVKPRVAASPAVPLRRSARVAKPPKKLDL